MPKPLLLKLLNVQHKATSSPLFMAQFSQKYHFSCNWPMLDPALPVECFLRRRPGLPSSSSAKPNQELFVLRVVACQLLVATLPVNVAPASSTKTAVKIAKYLRTGCYIQDREPDITLSACLTLNITPPV